jgi:RNA polymerase sigma factor (sigma-70 family)
VTVRFFTDGGQIAVRGTSLLQEGISGPAGTFGEPSVSTLPLLVPNPPDLDRWYHEHVLVHEQALRAYMRRAFPIVTDLDNVIQETFVRVLEARRSAPIENVRGYLFATARNQALTMMRRNDIVSIESITEIEALDIKMDEPDVAEKVGLKLEIELLTEAIQALPTRCREVLTLRKIEGLSQRDIAARMGISEHTVEVQVANGMRRCAQFLRDRGVLPPRKDPS